MTRDLKFFYFGNQCPHNCYLLARVKTYAFRERVRLHLFDLSEDPRPAAEYRIFSPTMLLANDEYRWHGPFTSEFITSLLEGEVEPSGQTVNQSEIVVRGELSAVDHKSVLSTSNTCAGSSDEGLCRGKSEWVHGILESHGLSNLGYIHKYGGKCVGGAELLPSEVVPYPIPDKSKKNAYLTCSYLSDDKHDYKTHPLEALRDNLRYAGFATLSVAASKDVAFPNGPSWWFEKKGFVDKGMLINEDLQNAEIHYLQLDLARASRE